MSDVRSMLRTERAARQQNAKPTKTRATPTTATPAPSTKKRKADSDEADGRKRAKATTTLGTSVPAGFFDDGVAAEPLVEADTEESGESLVSHPPAEVVKTQLDSTAAPTPGTLPQGFFDSTNASSVPTVAQPAVAPTTAAPIDEDEWAAFEREVATPPPQQDNKNPAVSAIYAGASIQAAPISAAELAAQARVEESTQRGRRDAEIEAEKEDAARHLEEEFDEMEALEARVRSLREKREALRQKVPEQVSRPAPPPLETPELDEDDDSDDDFEDDEWDNWRT